MLEWNGERPGSLAEDALDRMRRYRHARLCEAMARRGVPAVLFYDPINIRYATDVRNMQVYALNHDARYVFLTADGFTVLFDWYRGDVYFGGLDMIDEVRIGRPFGYVANDTQTYDDAVRLWAEEIAELMRAHTPDDMRLGFDRMSPFGFHALERSGVAPVDGQATLYEARSIKSPDEVDAMRISMAASRPFMTGMETSIKSTSGLRLCVIWTASRPLVASPTTSSSGTFCNRALIPSRTSS